LVLLRVDYNRCAHAYIYKSKYETWQSAVPSVTIPKRIRAFTPSILVQNALYWELSEGTIIELDLQRHYLDVIQKPRNLCHPEYHFQILRTAENRLGLAIASSESMGMELWERRTNLHGVVEWVLEKTVELDNILPHGTSSPVILHFIEDTNTILLSTNGCSYLFTIQLESMQCSYLGKKPYIIYYPYTNVYTGLEKVAK
jgi:hypothetical protein